MFSLGREQPVKPGYEHYVLYEQIENFPGKVEVLSQVQTELESDLEHRSEPDVAQDVELEPEAETVPEPEPLTHAERDAEEPVPALEAEPDGSQSQPEHQDGERRGGRIISMFGWRK